MQRTLRKNDERMRQMKRRTKIRILSFSLAALVAFTAWGLWGSLTVRRLTYEKDAVRGRALSQVCDYLAEIETTLQKASWAGTAGMLAGLSSDLHAEALGAKTGLAALSAGDAPLSNVYKFISQVGEYTAALQKKAERGETVTDGERQTLGSLRGYASDLKERFSYMISLLDAGLFSFDEIKEGLLDLDAADADRVSFITAATETEDSLKEYPTLIYDGPFSDHIMSKESRLLKDAEPVSETKAKTLAAKALGVDPAYLMREGESEGKLPCYHFSTGDRRVSVTKNGGFVLSILSDASAGKTAYTSRDAEKTAAAFLKQLGYADMTPTYSFTSDGICCLNFAGTVGDYTVYPDLIKVGVSLSDNKVVSMDAADYVMNHVPRTPPEPSLSEDEAKGVLSPDLTPQSTDFALIPTPGGGEVWAYEFLCKTPEDNDVLVYVDVTTGREADLLLLLYADGGTLTK